MRVRTAARILLSAGVATAIWVMGQSVTAEQEATPVPRDPYQRSTDIYLFQTSAKSGPQRGEVLYYFKCSFCHSQFAKAGSAGPRGPLLNDIFTRPTLTSGQPVNDQTVRDKILNGSPLVMPAYRSVLNETDMADLLSYIKSDTCCFDFQAPPPNPRYQAGR